MNALAGLAGTHRANILRFEKTGSGFSNVVLERIAAALGVSLSSLLDGHAPVVVRALSGSSVRVQEEDADLDDATEVRLPVYDVEVSAGPGATNPEFIETREHLTFQRAWLKKIGAREDQVKLVNVDGDSMAPSLWQGDKVAIHLDKRKVRSGKVFALAYNGEARIKRLFLLADGRLRIVSDNPDKGRYPDEFIEGDELNRVVIIGQAVHRMGEGGL